jgi:hypothetical protein
LELFVLIWAQDHPANVKAIFSAAGFLDTTSEHDVGVVLDSTSFYAEQGGQVSSQVLNLSWQKHIIYVIWKVLLIGWEYCEGHVHVKWQAAH